MVWYSLARAQEGLLVNRIDVVRPDAPELAAPGEYAIGVRTLHLVNPDGLDVVNNAEGEPLQTYDRPVTVEVWYPAAVAEGATPTPYNNVLMRDGKTRATLYGAAVRAADPLSADGPFPLIIISHGYPGNRYLMSHFGENLATKGYVTVALDHKDSTYDDQGAFGSTLLNRPLDQLFVLNEMARLGAEASSFLNGIVDTNTTGIIGYSMGGYGALNVIGGGFVDPATLQLDILPANGSLAMRSFGTPAYEATLDDRVKAAIAIGPWGMNFGFWSAETLQGIATPLMLMAGSADDISEYPFIVDIFDFSVNAERYLLTFDNANHNAAAPIGAPNEVIASGDFAAFQGYADAVWDNTRMNNIAQHFATAFMGKYLYGNDDLGTYLDVAVGDANDGVYSTDEDGTFTEAHTYWPGFEARTAKGLSLRYAPAAD